MTSHTDISWVPTSSWRPSFELDSGFEAAFADGKNEHPDERASDAVLNTASRILYHRKNGVSEQLASARAFAEGVARFGDNRDELRKLLTVLAGAKVLSQAEVVDRLDGKMSDSTVSMLRKIAERSEAILRPNVVIYLNASLTVLYQTARLFEDLGGDENGIKKLEEFLKNHDGPITRAWLIQIRNELKRRKGTGSSSYNAARDVEFDEIPSAGASSGDDPQSFDGRENNKSQPITVLLATPQRGDVARLTKDYMQSSEPDCLRLGHQVGERALLLVCAKLPALLSLVRNVEWWRFKRCSRVFLLSQPNGSDLTDCQALLIYTRGKFDLPDALPAGHDGDPVKLADALLEGVAGRRVHLFAQSATSGWEAVVGDDNWKTGGEA